MSRPAGSRRVRTSSGILALAACLFATAGASAVSTSGTILTVAGTGAASFSGDGGSATKAKLNGPTGVAVDAAGNVFVADTANHRIRKVTPAGVITTIAGTGAGGFSGDGGQATAAQLFAPGGVAVDGAGNVYVGDTSNNRVRKVAPDGTITTVAGTGTEGYTADGAPAVTAALHAPTALAVAADGTVYVVEYGGGRVRKILPSGTLVTVAGQEYDGFNGDGIPAASAQLDSPSGVAVDAAGNVYISDTDNNRIRRVGTDGIITTIAGTGAYGFGGDGGPATAAQFNGAFGVAVDAAGNVYFADLYNYRVRKIVPGSLITTVAGSGDNGFSGDLGVATAARLNSPTGIAVDAAGTLYVADTANNRIRKVIDLGPQLGKVARAWVSKTRTGPQVKRLPGSSREIWAHFVFVERPAPGLPIQVEFYGPRTKVGVVKKPNTRRIDAFIRVQSDARFVPGRWRVVLTVAGKPVATAAFTIEPFRLQ